MSIDMKKLRSRDMRLEFRALILVLMFTVTILLSQNCTKFTALTRETATQVSKPKKVSAQELARLRWIEGTWKGTGDVEKPFYERYYFENDTTLAVESYSDETLSKVSDVTRFQLKDGEFGNVGEGAHWAATELDESSITFAPVAKARNSFRWQRESKDLWKAVLDWPAADGKPARQRVYRMERLTPAK
jgi:hypothetical protein